MFVLEYKRTLEKRIANSENLSLDFRRLIIAMIDCKREDFFGRVDSDKILKDVMVRHYYLNDQGTLFE